MSRTILTALAFLLFSAPARGQTAPNDSQTLQALLAEVRQLRQDLHTTILVAQRAQILIYRVQAEETAVERVQQRLENTASKRAQLEEKRKGYEAQSKWYEKRKDETQNSAEQKKYEDEVAQMKAQIDAFISEEQEIQAKEAEFREQLRTEQAKLGRLQDDLDRLDKALENSNPGSGVKPQ